MNISSEKVNKIRVGITTGDINGIGIEVIMKTFLDNRMLQICTPVIYGSSKTISYHRKALNINEFNYNPIRTVDSIIDKKINVVNCWEEEIKIELGQATEVSAQYSLKSLVATIDDLLKGKLDAIVTAPINKKNIQNATFNFPGHTEYLAEKFGTADYLMFMVSETIKVGLVTSHIPLKDVAPALTIDKIVQKIKVLNESLIKDFSVRKPRIAVLGLNPHAGDDGLIGTEEKEIIEPAIKRVQEERIFAYGPYPSDGFFGSSSLNQYDAVLAMYHDQGLIPFKTIAFENGVNFTAGLPIIRTSPDHGTAFDIAGKNKASETSFREAIYLACNIYKKRQEFKELTSNPLPLGFSKLSKDQ